MFDPILIPMDGSLLAECVLSHTISFTRAFNSRPLLLRVLDKGEQHVSAQLFDVLNWEIQKTEANRYLEQIDARLQKFGLTSEITVLEGLVAESIIKFSQNQAVQLIILSSHGESGVSQWGISSIAQKIILNVQTSVLIVRAHHPASIEVEQQEYKRILVPLDGSRRAENVLPMVANLARFHNSEIHIAFVVIPPEMARQLPPVQEDIDLANRIVERNRRNPSVISSRYNKAHR